MNILVADKFEPAGLDALKALGSVAYEPGAGAEGLAAAIASHRPEVLIVRSTKVRGPVIAGAAGLKAIIRAGAGVDNIDLAAATAAGIRVCNCPGMNAVAVAELALGLLLACDRRIVDQTADLRTGRWSKKEYGSKARGLKGSTLGIVGLGAIGEAVARRASAFEMNVVGWSRSLTPETAGKLGIAFGGNTRADLLKLAASCDAFSIHIALTPETRHLCDASFFAALKPGAIFINTSRGGVVDEAALREAAAAKKLRCGLDVYENQPANPEAEFSTPITSLPGSAFTHHCGASTDQAQSAVADEAVRIVRVYKETGRLENCVNP